MVTSDHFCNNCGLRFGNEESLKMHDCEEIMAEPEDSGSEYEILSDDELFSDNDEIENNISHEEGNLLRVIVNWSGAARSVIQGPKQSL